MLFRSKRLTTEVAEGSLQMSGDEMFVEVFGPEHHGCVRGYGDGISPTELWGSSSSTIRDLQMQLKESEERSKESDANVQLLKAQVNRVESLLAQVLKNMAPFELAQFDCSS